MNKNVEITILMDFYGDFLTQRQLDALKSHYEYDMSLSEIAEQYGISRQGVRDSLVRGESTLIGMEDRLGLAKKCLETLKGLKAMRALAETGMANAEEQIRKIDALICIWEE